MTTPMRQQMAETVTNLGETDHRVVVLLGNISTTYFARSLKEHPLRVWDMGICEQAMTSVAAGLALEGLVPVVHTLAPFLVERSFEQLKDDFCYQRLGGNFISVGASYDYSIEGMTHHAPGDVEVLQSLPGMRIVVPGTAGEFDRLFRSSYASGSPTYFRLSLRQNEQDHPVEFGRARRVSVGSRGTIVAVGPLLDTVLEAVRDLDVTVLYYTTLAPFDEVTLRENLVGDRIFLVEPFYAGTLTRPVLASVRDAPIRIGGVGVPREILSRYGTPEEHHRACGLTVEGIRSRLLPFLEGTRPSPHEASVPT